jgi:rare lipoprotein A (peptidoglycan hydrolase)
LSRILKTRRLIYTDLSKIIRAQQNMTTATFVFMIATYWVGGSGPTEGGKYLANGQFYNSQEFIAAHRTLPLGTILNVCLRRQCVAVVVKDRGPFLRNMDIERRLDLSYAAAKVLGMLGDGRQRVRVSVPVPTPRPDLEDPASGLIAAESE